MEELRRRSEPFLGELLPEGREMLAIEAIQGEMRVLADAPRLLTEITSPVNPGDFVQQLPQSSAAVYAHVEKVMEGRKLEYLVESREFVRELRTWAKGEGIKTRDLLHPLRLALTGRDRGPEMAYLLAILGAEESRARIERAREARLGA
jgi:glutamyl/glutaminyl-tRNA synthetase